MTAQIVEHNPEYRQPRRPLKALRHFRKLTQNKEDTTQVFHIVEALNGDNFQKQFLRFANSERGQARLAERRYLPPILDDHEAMSKHPEGSFGHAYLDFMTSQDLTAQGLVDEFEASGIRQGNVSEDMMWYGDRLRDTHDMLHVLTDLSRDALGEASVLGFTHGLTGGFGIAFIAYGATLEIRKHAPKGTPLMRSVREAQILGRKADHIAYYDILELLPLPLDEVRARLNIKLPQTYHRAHVMMREHGLDPFGIVGANPDDTCCTEAA